MGQGFVAVVTRALWELLVVNVAPTALISLFEEVARLWLATTLELTLSLASSSVCRITDFPGLPVVQKKVCDSLKQSTTSILHTMRQPWGVHKSVFFSVTEIKVNLGHTVVKMQCGVKKEYWIC